MKDALRRYKNCRRSWIWRQPSSKWILKKILDLPIKEAIWQTTCLRLPLIQSVVVFQIPLSTIQSLMETLICPSLQISIPNFWQALAPSLTAQPTSQITWTINPTSIRPSPKKNTLPRESLSILRPHRTEIAAPILDPACNNSNNFSVAIQVHLEAVLFSQVKKWC